MPAPTRQPSRYRRTVDAKPSPRAAPVMMTVRGSAILVLWRAGALTGRRRLYVGATVGQTLLPGGPLPDRERSFGTCLLVVALRVVHLGLGVRPRARDRRGQPTRLDRPEPPAIGEVRHVDDREHHQERAEHRLGREQLGLRGELLRHRLSGVVAVDED